MAIINKGTAFSNGEQLSASKLNDLVDGATFGTDSVDNASTLLNGTGAITVRDSGITAAKLATNAVTTAKILDANVTFAKLTNVIDDDTMATATATTLATSGSIKAYVDSSAQTFVPASYAGEESVTLPNGLIMKWGVVNIPSTGSTVSFGTAFPSDCINVITSAHGADALAGSAGITAFSTSGFTANPKYGNDFHWQAIGY